MRLFNLSHSFASFLNVNYRTLKSPSVGSELDCNPCFVGQVNVIFVVVYLLFKVILFYLNIFELLKYDCSSEGFNAESSV